MGEPVATSVAWLRASGAGGGIGEPVATGVSWLRASGVGGGIGEPVAKSTELEPVLPFAVTLTKSITGSTISSDRASRTKA